jgi:hypothetical protein
MKCGKLSRLALFALLFLAFFSVQASLQAQSLSANKQTPNSQPLSLSISDTLPLPINSWESWDIASIDFKNALMLLVNYWEIFNPLLEKLGISFEDFPAYMNDLTAQVKSLEEAIIQERETSDTIIIAETSKRLEAEEERDKWRTTAIVGTASALVIGIAAGLLIH